MPRHFSDWIEAYLSLVRGKTEAPEVYSYWSAVATIAAALTRSVWIDEVRYRFYPNFLIVLAARPGVAKKSTTIDECVGILRDMDIKPSLFGPQETTWPALCESFAKHAHRRPVGSADPAALDTEFDVQCAMTLCLREFGTFLRPGDRDMINGITDLWDGGDRVYIKSTKTSGVDTIQNPFLNIIGAATAQWLRDNFREFAGWGIASRIIFVHSDADPTPIWSPSKLIDSSSWQNTRTRLQDDLRDIMLLRGPFRFAADAANRAKAWYEEVMRTASAYARTENADTWVCDFLARKQVHAHKLAMVLAASRRSDLTITLADYEDAIARVEAIESEIRRIFAITLVPSPAAAMEHAIFAVVKGELCNGLAGTASRRYIFNRIAAYVDGGTADRILSSFVRRGVLHEEVNREGPQIILSENADEIFNYKH